MSYVVSSARQVAATLRPGQLVVLESTTYPGTTDELLRGILEGHAGIRCHPEGAAEAATEGSPQSGTTALRCGADFFLAFSPEREDPGNKNYGTTNTPKVVGGVDEVSGDLAQALYDQIIAKTVRVSSARAAEATKLMENIFRAVNIALVNELKVVYDRMGIDIWEVLDAAETKPFGFMRFNPGPGWGGHCIPLDPFYLAWKAREVGAPTKFIELAGEVNVNMPRYVVGKLQHALNERGKAVKGSKVLILGVAYKKDIDDPRESPAFEIMDLLRELGAGVRYHDPHIPEVGPTRRHPDKQGLRSIDLSAEIIAAQDAVLIVTNHSAVDYGLVASAASLVIDTRGIFRSASPRIVRA
jgi:UDP-N-acetyl-D-glucosamine dehydrogenase